MSEWWNIQTPEPKPIALPLGQDMQVESACGSKNKQLKTLPRSSILTGMLFMSAWCRDALGRVLPSNHLAKCSPEMMDGPAHALTNFGQKLTTEK